MKQFSRFRPFGHGAIKGEALGKRLYDAALEAIGHDANFAGDENLRGKLYADAMLAASARIMVEKAHAEMHPLSTEQFLELHETENGLSATPGQSRRSRQAFLQQIKALDINGRISTIHQALQTFLGDALVGYRVVRRTELGAEEKSPNPRGNQSDWQTPMRVVRFLVPAAQKSRNLRIPVEFVGGDVELFSVGQQVVANAGSYARSEVVTILASSANSITARFTKPHDAGTFMVGGHHPRHWSSKRTHIIILGDGKALDPTVVSGVNLLMRRLVKGTARWCCVDETTAFTSGPFLVGEGLLGVTTIGATSI